MELKDVSGDSKRLETIENIICFDKLPTPNSINNHQLSLELCDLITYTDSHKYVHAYTHCVHMRARTHTHTHTHRHAFVSINGVAKFHPKAWKELGGTFHRFSVVTWVGHVRNSKSCQNRRAHVMTPQDKEPKGDAREKGANPSNKNIGLQHNSPTQGNSR